MKLSLLFFFIVLNIFFIKTSLSFKTSSPSNNKNKNNNNNNNNNNVNFYINFIPYVKGTHCDSKVIGVGYSMILNTCVSFDVSMSSWFFTLDQSSGLITGKKFNGGCDGVNWNETMVYKFQRDGCNEAGITFDMFRVPTQGFDYQVKISTSPVTVAGTYVKRQTAGSGCDTSNILLGQEFSTNGTITKSVVDQYFTYYCINQIPTVIDNNNPNGNYKGITCRKISTFYNGSAEISQFVSGSGDGDSSASSGSPLTSTGRGYDTGGDTASSAAASSSISSDTGDPTTASQTSDNPTTAYSTGDGASDTASASSSNNAATSGGQSTGNSGTSGALTSSSSANSDTSGALTSSSSANSDTSGVTSNTNSGGTSGGDVSSTSGGTSGGNSGSSTSGGTHQKSVYLYSYCS